MKKINMLSTIIKMKSWKILDLTKLTFSILQITFLLLITSILLDYNNQGWNTIPLLKIDLKKMNDMKNN